MKLNPVGANQTEIERADGKIVLYSYKTPVAVFVPGHGAMVTNKRWSVTTSRHINKALFRWGCSRNEATQEEVEKLAS